MEHELPSIKLDHEILQYLASTLEGGEDDAEEVAKWWRPYLEDLSVEGEHVDEVCRNVLRKLKDDCGASTSKNTVECHPHDSCIGDKIKQNPVEGHQSDACIGNTIREDQAEALAGWLARLHLQKHETSARRWCEDNGFAMTVEGVKQKVENFSQALQLKPLEKKRVLKDFGLLDCGPKNCAAPSSSAAARGLGPAAPKPSNGLVEDVAPKTFGAPDKRYVLLEELGSGVTATVYRCHREGKEDTDFAVKVISLTRLRLQIDPTRVLEKMHRESAILFNLHHSHIVSLIDVFETRENLYLVMEHVDGGNLHKHIVRNGRLHEHEARNIFIQLVRALKYIHSKGFVHRDLKPENILLNQKPSQTGLLEVKISDFGTSKIVDDGVSTLHTRVGTPQFWAPEVSDPTACAQGYTETVDLWSLGVVLYIMLEAEYPFDGVDARVEDQIKQANFSFRREGAPSNQAQNLIRKLMKVTPTDRLSLEGCLNDPWMQERLAHVMSVCPREGDVDEELFTLESLPVNVSQLRKSLNTFTIKFKASALLRKRQVVVTWSACENRAAAREELMKLIGTYCSDFSPQVPDTGQKYMLQSGTLCAQ